jgi:2,3-bisphosphoglycerate-independent phosphoglycerate mutase
VDLALSRLIKAVEAAQGVLIVSADHVNAEDMFERNKKTGKVTVDPETGAPKMKTAHSLNPVPCLIYDTTQSGKITLAAHSGLGISSLAATVIRLLGYEPPADYDPSVVDLA